MGNEAKLDEKEKVSWMLAQIDSTDLPQKSQQRSKDSEGILQKLDLSRIDECEHQIQQEA